MKDVGVGMYSVPEASDLTGIDGGKIRRWLWGTLDSEPLWRSGIDRIQGQLFLSFQDLTELQFVRELRRAGLGFSKIRRSLRKLEERFGPYPLSSQRFRTDGQALYVEDPESGFEVESGQTLFGFHFENLFPLFDYSSRAITRWWPLGRDHDVVVDPERAFGQPILHSAGIPTKILSEAVVVEGSADTVARLYEVPRASIDDALELERSLLAA